MTVARNLLLVAGLATLILGFWWHPLDTTPLLPPLLESVVLAAAAGLFAWLLARWLRLTPAAVAWGVCVPALGLLFAGVPAAAATAGVLLAGAALGTLLPRVDGTSPLLRILAGMGLLAGLAGWLLPFPVHHAGSWALAIIALVTWRHRAIRADLHELAREARDAFAGAPRAAFVVGLLAVVATAPAWLPVRMADDVNYHLLLGWELMTFGHARFDVGTQVWALAPWSTDVLHALVMVLAGRETIGFLNAFWLLAAAWCVRGLAGTLGLAPRWCWLACAAYVTLPMTYMLAGSLQVESATPAWMAALATLLAARAAPGRPPLFLIATLAGCLVGSKLTNGLLLLPFFVWWLLQWRGRLPWRELPTAVALGLFAAGSSYFYSYWLTGNPVLPLANGVFGSPWFLPENFIDTTWTQALGWDLPWRWVLQSQQFHEGAAGSAGVIVLALLGGLVLAIAAPRTRPVALATLVAALLLLSQIQYLRYLHPLMPLFAVLMVAGFSGTGSAWRQVAIGALVALQLALLPTASWMLMRNRLAYLAWEGRNASLLSVVPERVLAGYFREMAMPGEFVLFAHSAITSVAELPGRSASASWHTGYIWSIRRFGKDWPAMLEASGATHVITRDLASEPELARALDERGAVALVSAGPATLYRLTGVQVPVDTSETADGVVRARLPMDAVHPVTGWLQVELGCGQPGETIALVWSLDRPGRAALPHWDVVTCDGDSKARPRMYFDSLPVDGSLRFEARRVQDIPGTRLELVEARAERRRDPSAASERYHVVWDALCARPGCGRDQSRLQPHPWQQDPRR
jgi:hypothetical protein